MSESHPEPSPAEEDVEVVPDGGPQVAEVPQDDADTTFVEKIERDYRTWVALQPLMVGGVVAFARGQAVPESHPWRETWQNEGLIGRRAG